MDRTRSKVLWMLAALFFLALGLASGRVFNRSAQILGAPLTMAALVALPFAGWIFIAAIRHAVGSSRALRQSLTWWHGLWFLTFMSMLVFRVRGAGDIEENPLDAWALYRVSLEGLVALILLIRLALRRTEWLESLFRGLPCSLAVYGIVCLCSTGWSVFPLWTLYKSAEFMVDIVLLAAILATINSTEEYRSLLNWTWFLYGLLLISTWIGAAVAPDQALYAKGFPVGLLGFQLRGVLPALSANDVGTYGAILAVIAAARLLPISGHASAKAWYTLLFVASVTTMICSQTRSAVAGFLFAILLLLVYSRRYAISAVTTFVLTPIIILSSLGGLLWSFLQRGQSENQLAHMSSRLDWWSFAWDKFLDRPLTGFGAYAGGRFAVLAEHGFSKTSTMHSDYVEVLVGTGFWGIIPVVAAIVGAWWYLRRTVRARPGESLEAQIAYEGIAILGLLTVRSLFMTMLTWHAPLHFLAVLGLAEFLRRKEVESREWEEIRATAIRPVEPSPSSV